MSGKIIMLDGEEGKREVIRQKNKLERKSVFR